MITKLLSTLLICSLFSLPLAQISHAQISKIPKVSKFTEKENQNPQILPPSPPITNGILSMANVDCDALLKAEEKEVRAKKQQKPKKDILTKTDEKFEQVEAFISNPFGKSKGRKWTKEQQCQALVAKQLFKIQLTPPPRNVISNNPQEIIYNPANTQQAQMLLAKAQEVEQKYAERQPQTAAEQQEIEDAYFPFFRYAEAVGITSESQLREPIKFIGRTTIIIPPRKDVRIRLIGGCMDGGLPAAPRGEKLHLVYPDSQLLATNFQPIYTALMKYSADHTDEVSQAQVQRIIWNMRHGCFRKMNQLRALRLIKEDEQLLDSLVPGATATFKKECEGFDWKQLGKDFLTGLLNGSSTDLEFDPVGLVNASRPILEVRRQQDARITINEPLPENDNSDYTMLKDGVAIKNEHSGGAGATDVIIRNITDQPVEFTPVGWAMESRRATQRIYISSFGGAEFSLSPLDMLLLATMFMPASWAGKGLFAIGRWARGAWTTRAAKAAEAAAARSRAAKAAETVAAEAKAADIAAKEAAAIKAANRIKADSLKEFKSLVNQLSKPESEITTQELRQLEKLTEKFGGKLRYDLNPVKGKTLKPHVQVEGLGTTVKSRHIWLGEGVR